MAYAASQFRTTWQIDCVLPRSTWSHCGSLNALDQRVPVLPSTAADAGRSGVLRRGGGGRLVQRGVRSCRSRRRWSDRAVDLELPERVAVLRRAGRAVHADVAAGAGDVQRLGAAGAGGGGVDRGPGRAVVRGLDLERGGVGRLPLQDDLVDGRGRAEVHLEPLRVAERAGPAGAGVAVGGVGRRVPGVLRARRRSSSCPATAGCRRRGPPSARRSRRPPGSGPGAAGTRRATGGGSGVSDGGPTGGEGRHDISCLVRGWVWVWVCVFHGRCGAGVGAADGVPVIVRDRGNTESALSQVAIVAPKFPPCQRILIPELRWRALSALAWESALPRAINTS